MNNYDYTIEHIVGHLAALEDHLENKPCPICLMKHINVLKVYFHEIEDIVQADPNRLAFFKNCKNEFLNIVNKKLTEEDRSKLRDLRNEIIKFSLGRQNG